MSTYTQKYSLLNWQRKTFYVVALLCLGVLALMASATQVDASAPVEGGDGSQFVEVSSVVSTTTTQTVTLDKVFGKWGDPAGNPTCEEFDPQTQLETGENQIRYGIGSGKSGCFDTPFDKKSGFGFEGTGSGTFDTGEAFLLGQFTHYNNPIRIRNAGSFTTVPLNITIDLGTPDETVTQSYTVRLDETPNGTPGCPLYGGDSNGCFDRVIFPNSLTQQTFDIGTVSYTLQIAGFLTPENGECSATGAPISQFITKEKKDNVACLYGRILVAAPAIDVDKTLDETDPIPYDSTANFTIEVQNTGNVDLTNVVVTDAQCDAAPVRTNDGNGDQTLQPGETWTYECSTANVIANFTNTAKATADAGNQEVSDQDSADVTSEGVGNIIIVKDTVPNSPQNFSFTTTGGLQPEEFDLDDDADGALSNMQTFNLVKPGTYTVTEVSDDAYTTMVKCLVQNVDDSATTFDGYTATIDLQKDQTVICTFYNTEKQATLTVTKVVDGGDAQVSDFPLFVDNTAVTSGESNSFDAGVYVVSETGKDNYDATFSGDCADDGSITLEPGEDYECTITNTYVPPTYTIFLLKVTDPVNRGMEFYFEWPLGDFNGDPDNDGDPGQVTILSDAGDVNLSGVTPGVYTVTELVPEGWDLTSVVCNDQAMTITNNGVDVDLTSGDVSCTFFNTQRGSITIHKDVIGDKFLNQGFDLLYDNTSYVISEGSAESFEETNLVEGTYTFEEDVPAGWELTNINCGDNQNNVQRTENNELVGIDIVLEPGEDVVCTFENTPLPGTILVEKVVSGDGDVNNPSQSFALNISDSKNVDSDYDVTAGADAVGRMDLLAGETYVVKEDLNALPEGWALTNLVCESELGTSVIEPFIADSDSTEISTLGAGDTVTCTFTNTYVPPTGSITFVKAVLEGSTTSEFDFEIDFGSEVRSYTLTDGDSSPTFELPPGDYDISETFPIGEKALWQALAAEDIDCNSTGNSTFAYLPFADEFDTFGVKVTLASGDDVTCTFYNTQLLASLGDFVWEDLDEDGIQDDGEPGVGGVTVNLLDEGDVAATTTTAANGFYAFTDLIAPNGYQVEFVLPEGYEFTTQDVGNDDSIDSDADPNTGLTGIISLEPGEYDPSVDAGLVAIPPVCEPGDEDPILHLNNDFTDIEYIEEDGRVVKAIGTVRNTSDRCAYYVGMASYERFDNGSDKLKTQELFDSDPIDPDTVRDSAPTDGGVLVGPGETVTLEVDVPRCASQVDLFFDADHLAAYDNIAIGDVEIVPLILPYFRSNLWGDYGKRYNSSGSNGNRLLSADGVNGTAWCNLTETGECPVVDTLVIGLTDQPITDDGTTVTLEDQDYTVEVDSDPKFSRVEFDFFEGFDPENDAVPFLEHNEGTGPFFLFGDSGGTDDPQGSTWNPFTGQINGTPHATDGDRILEPGEYTLRVTVFRGFGDGEPYQLRPCGEIEIRLVVPEPTGTIIIEKTVAKGSRNTQFDFGLFGPNPPFNSNNETPFQLKKDESETFELEAGRYAIAEYFENGWTVLEAGDVMCESRDGNELGLTFAIDGGNMRSGPTINLVPGDEVTCKFTNEHATFSLGNCYNEVGPLAGTFTLTVANGDYPAHLAYQVAGGSFVELGEFAANETRLITGVQIEGNGPTNTLTKRISTNGGVSYDPINRGTGVLNPERNPCKGSITIEKHAEGGENVTFDFTADIVQVIDRQQVTVDSFDLNGGESETFEAVEKGVYEITELAEDGWELESIMCETNDEQNSSPAVINLDEGKVTIDLRSGEHVTCTFVNVEPQPICEMLYGNLVVNGCFEEPEVPNNWDIFDTVPGWDVEWLDSEPCTTGINPSLELQTEKTLASVDVPQGNQYAELDTDCDGPGSDTHPERTTVEISQTLNTVPGYEYEVSFYYTNRPGHNGQELSVEIDDVDVAFDTDGDPASGWVEGTFKFVATSEETEISFADTGKADSFGILIDCINVVQGERVTGTLTVEKKVDAAGFSPTEPAQGFEICVVGLNNGYNECKYLPLEGGEMTWGPLFPDQYTITETTPLPEGWTVVTNNPLNVAINAGDDKKRKITNRYIEPERPQAEICVDLTQLGITPYTPINGIELDGLVSITANNGGDAQIVAVGGDFAWVANGTADNFSGGGSPDYAIQDRAFKHDYTFDFADDIIVSDFSLRLYDWSDYNPAGSSLWEVELSGVNADTDGLSFTGGTTGDAGDSNKAIPGQPGNRRFAITGTDITEAYLMFGQNGATTYTPSRHGEVTGANSADPYIGFDELCITYEDRFSLVDIEKVWLSSNGRNQIDTPTNLVDGFSITATSSADTLTCSYDGDSLTCASGNPVDSTKLLVPDGETYTVEETLADGWFNVDGLGDFTCADETCTHTVTNRVNGLNPTLECIYSPNNKVSFALYGYDNRDDETLNVPFDTDGNKFTGNVLEYLSPVPEDFLPGRQVGIFWVKFGPNSNGGGNIVWTLNHPISGFGGTASAAFGANTCGDRVPPASLTVKKKVQTAGFPNADDTLPQDGFEICVYDETDQEVGCANHMDGDTATYDGLAPGKYTIIETTQLPNGWTVKGNEKTINLRGGDDKKHTITNTYVRPERPQAEICVDLSQYGPDALVEGAWLGAGSNPELLKVTTTSGNARIVQFGTAPFGWVSNGTSDNFSGGESPDNAIMDLDHKHEYTFMFADDIIVTNFSLRLYDWGDYNPARATDWSVTLRSGETGDTDGLMFMTPANGNLGSAGDSNKAIPGQPGNRNYAIMADNGGLTMAELVFTQNGNPNYNPSRHPARSGATSADPYIGIDELCVTYTEVEPVSIWVEKYEDTNGDGLAPNFNDANAEPRATSATFTFDLYDGDGEVATGMTGAGNNGKYYFGMFEPGTYTMCEDETAGWINTFASPGPLVYDPADEGRACVSQTLESGQDWTFVFANYELPKDTDISIDKRAPGGVYVDAEFEYTFKVKNNGPADATGVVVTDTLPAEVEFVSSNDCTHDNGTLTCEIGDLAVDEQVTLKATVKAIGEPESRARNEACVGLASPSDVNMRNNCDSTITNIVPVPPENGICAPTRYIEPFNQGPAKNGGLVAADRSNPAKALDFEGNNDNLNFVSLGYGGELILVWENEVIVNNNGPAPDIVLWETTYNDKFRLWSAYPEQAKVYASQDGVTWEYLGLARKDTAFDLGALPWARYIKIVDDTAAVGGPSGDAFDVDYVSAYECGEEPTSSLTIKKVVVDNADYSNVDPNMTFNFYEAGDLINPIATLMDGGESVVFAEPGEYTISEQVLGNWNQSVECVGDDNIMYPISDNADAIVDLDPGEDVVCTFTNEVVTQSLTFVKALADGTPAHDSNWEFTLTELSCSGGCDPVVIEDFGVVDNTIPGAGGTGLTITVPVGNVYRVGEIVPEGYDLLNIDCGDGGNSATPPLNDSFTILTNGVDLTCTFTNVAEQPPVETPEVCNSTVMIMDLPETAEAGDLISAFASVVSTGDVERVEFTLSQGDTVVDTWTEEVAPYYFKGDNDGTPNMWMVPGSLEGEYTLTATVIVDGEPCGIGSDTITIEAKPVTTPPTEPETNRVTIQKTILPFDAQLEEQVYFTSDLSDDVNGDTPGEFNMSNLDGQYAFDVVPGMYSVTELVPQDWSLTGVSCNQQAMTITNGNTIMVDATGGDVLCIFTNEPVVTPEPTPEVTPDPGPTCPASVDLTGLPSEIDFGEYLLYPEAVIDEAFLNDVEKVVFELYDANNALIDTWAEEVTPYFYKGDDNGIARGWNTADTGATGQLTLKATVYVDGEPCGTGEGTIYVTPPPLPDPLHCPVGTTQYDLFTQLTKLRATSPTQQMEIVNLPAAAEGFIIGVTAVGHPELGCPDSGHPWCNQTNQTMESLNVFVNGNGIGNVPDHGTDKYAPFPMLTPFSLSAGDNTILFEHAHIGADGIQSVEFIAALCVLPTTPDTGDGGENTDDVPPTPEPDNGDGNDDSTDVPVDPVQPVDPVDPVDPVVEDCLADVTITNFPTNPVTLPELVASGITATIPQAQVDQISRVDYTLTFQGGGAPVLIYSDTVAPFDISTVDVNNVPPALMTMTFEAGTYTLAATAFDQSSAVCGTGTATITLVVLPVVPVPSTSNDAPPVSQQSVEQPPVEQPPVEQPPVEQPPAEQPPVEQPPAEQPPVEQPPAEQPPVEQPPAEQSPTDPNAGTEGGEG